MIKKESSCESGRRERRLRVIIEGSAQSPCEQTEICLLGIPILSRSFYNVWIDASRLLERGDQNFGSFPICQPMNDKKIVISDKNRCNIKQPGYPPFRSGRDGAAGVRPLISSISHLQTRTSSCHAICSLFEADVQLTIPKRNTRGDNDHAATSVHRRLREPTDHYICIIF
jgi:hypothetical protein